MRVLLSGYTCDPNGGSEAANTWYTALELARAGVEVHLLTRQGDAHRAAGAVPDGVRLSVTGLSDQVRERIPLGPLRYYAPYAAFQRQVTKWLLERDDDWEITHHVSWGSIVHPVGLCAASGQLVVGPVGGGQSLRPELERYVDGPVVGQQVRNALLKHVVPGLPWSRRTVRRAATVLTTNRETLDLVRRLGASQTQMALAEGIRSLPEPWVASRTHAGTIVWIGRFLPIKAAGLAIDVFRNVLETNGAARMVMVGDGPTRATIAARAADLLRRGNLEMMGGLPWASAQAILASGRVHLFTSVRDSSSAQTLEAASHGVPTVALALAGVRDFYSGAGRLVSPEAGDVAEALAAEVCHYLDMSEGARRQSADGPREVAAQHLYAKRAQSLAILYQDLLS